MHTKKTTKSLKKITPLAIAQFLGAAHDNILKQLIVLLTAPTAIWADHLGAGGQGLAANMLAIPFILLSGWAGEAADLISKHKIAIALKALEIPIAALAIAAFLFGNFWLAMTAFTLIAVQSALFGPAKYGLIPETLEAKHVESGNGIIITLTQVAVITGTIVAGLFATQLEGDGTKINQTAALQVGVVLAVITLGGLIASLFIPPVPIANPIPYRKGVSINPFSTYIKTWNEIRGGPMIRLLILDGSFALLGGMLFLVMSQYKPRFGNVGVSMLLGIAGLSIGAGGLLVKQISKNKPSLRLVGPAMKTMSFSFGILAILGPSMNFIESPTGWWLLALGMVVLGACAGAYIVPIASEVQLRAPEDRRGRYLGTINASSFIFFMIGNLVFYLVARYITPSPKFMMALMAIGTGLISLNVQSNPLQSILSKENLLKINK